MPHGAASRALNESVHATVPHWHLQSCQSATQAHRLFGLRAWSRRSNLRPP